MEGAIGSTTTAIAVADEVKLFRGRVLGKAKQMEEERFDSRGRTYQNPEPLSILCLKVMANHFAVRPMIRNVPDRQIPLLTSMLDVDLDIEIASANIFDENYWKRRAMTEPWKHFEIANHGMTWKQLYLERKLQDLLEEFIPDEDLRGRKKVDTFRDLMLDEEKSSKKEDAEPTEEVIISHLKASQDYVFQLKVSQLLSHIDMNILFDSLPNLTRLELTYGVKRIGMHYERSLFGMKMSDATSLACAIKNSYTLTTLCLPCNLIDDDLLRMLMTGLIANCTVTHLDLSHNKITNHGVRLISKLLGPKSVLTTLDLCDNQIHVEGGRYLGRALRRNNSLLDLNLRLNRLTDEGGRLLLEGIAQNSSLAFLNLSCNSLASKSGRALCQLFEQKRSNLCAINLSCNELTEEDGEALAHTFRKECQLVSLDLRKNHLESSEQVLNEIVKRSELNVRRKENA